MEQGNRARGQIFILANAGLSGLSGLFSFSMKRKISAKDAKAKAIAMMRKCDDG